MDECFANIRCAPDLGKHTVCTIRDNAKKLYFQAFISTSLLVSLITYKMRLPLL